jgi:hypothetical protein
VNSDGHKTEKHVTKGDGFEEIEFSSDNIEDVEEFLEQQLGPSMSGVDIASMLGFPKS